MAKKVSIAAPSVDSAKQTLVRGVSATAGFLGGRFARNKVPQLNSMPAKAGLLLAALALHSSIEGDGLDANALRGLTLGFGINQGAQLADVAGQKLLVKRDTEAGTNRAMNGLLDNAAALLTDNYVEPGSPVMEYFQEMSTNGLMDYSALNSYDAIGSGSPLS